jgi:hypothetical protein
MSLSPIRQRHQGEHDWNLDEHAHHGGERSPTLEAEQTDGDGHGQLEEIRGTDR